MPWTSDVVKRVLPNGLTLLAQCQPSARVVAVVTHVQAGYFDEPDEWVGISHVLEHMFFKGTARLGPGAIARETRMVGGYLNASTTYDKTVYHTVLPAADGGLPRALEIQADALRNAALDPEELARELEVIIQEAGRKRDTPRAVAGETLYQLLFRVHRMRRWRIGTEAGLRRLGSQALRAYYQTRYTPDRTIVALVGDLDRDRALDLAARAYGDWAPPRAALPPAPREPDGRSALLRVLRGDVARPLTAVGWRTVGALHPDTPALDAAAQLLGAGRGSRLWRGVRHPGLATGVGASHYTPTEVGVFQLSIEAEGDRLDQAVGRTLALTADLATGEPGEPEMARVRGLTQAQWAAQFESMEGRAGALCQFEALGAYELADTWYQRSLAVTAAQVRGVAERYLGSEGVCAVLYLPPNQATGFEARWPPLASGREAPPAPRWTVAVRAGSGALPSGAEAYPGDVAHLASPRSDLLVRPKRGAGLVSLGIYAPNLRGAEPPGMAGLTALLLRGALRGAGGLAAPELAFATETLGGAVGPMAGSDVCGWSITVPVASAARAASLLRTIALEPALDEDELGRERRLQADEAARARDDMFRYPVQRALKQGFGADPYGQPQLGEPETVARLSAAAVREAARRLRQSRPVAVAVGDLSAGELLSCLAPLADWPSPGGPGKAIGAGGAPLWAPGCGLEVREKAQTALALAFPAPPAASPDRHALEVMGALLSGLAGRLFQALREQRSLAYTVSALPWLRRRGGAVVAYIATAPERESEAREGMLDQLARLARDPVSAEELEGARRYAAGLEEIGRQHGAAVAGELVEAWVNGTLADWQNRPQRLRAVGPEDVLRVAGEVFRREMVAEYVVRGGEGSPCP